MIWRWCNEDGWVQPDPKTFHCPKCQGILGKQPSWENARRYADKKKGGLHEQK